MDENVNIWNKKQSDLTVKDQLKIGIVAPVLAGAVVFVPLWAYGKILERRELRAQKKASLALVETPDEAV
jgi:hypothetical protein